MRVRALGPLLVALAVAPCAGAPTGESTGSPLLGAPEVGDRFLKAHRLGDEKAMDAVVFGAGTEQFGAAGHLLLRHAEATLDGTAAAAGTAAALLTWAKRSERIPRGRGLPALVARWLAWDRGALEREVRLRAGLAAIRAAGKARDPAAAAAAREAAKGDVASAVDSPAAVAVLDDGADLLTEAGEPAAAMEALLDAARRADAMPWPRASVRVWGRLTVRFGVAGRNAEALDAATRMAAGAAAANDPRHGAVARRWRADTLLVLGKPDEARGEAQAALGSFRALKVPYPGEVGLTLLTLARIELHTGHADRAQAAATEARETFLALGQRVEGGLALDLLARAAAADGRLAEGVTLLERALDEVKGSPANEARLLAGLADLHYQLGHTEIAVDLHRRAAAALLASGEVAAADVAKSSAALALAREDRHADAVALFREVLDGVRRRRDAESVASTLLNLGVSLTALGRLDEAAEAYAESRTGFSAIGRPADAAWATSGLAEVRLLQGRREEAIALGTEAADFTATVGLRTASSALVHLRLARILRDAGRDADAVGHARTALHIRRYLAASLAEDEAERLRRLARYAADEGVALAYRLHRAAGDEAGRSRAASAGFEFVEASRAAVLADALAQRGDPHAAALPQDLLAEDRATRGGVEAAQAEVLAAARQRPPDAARVAAAKTALDLAYGGREAAVARIARITRLGSALEGPEAVTLEGVRAALAEGTALVAYHRTEHDLFAVVATRTTAAFLRLDAPEDLDDLLRSWVDLASSAGGPEADLAARLYDVVVRPLEPALGDAKTIVVVPDAPLAAVPFGALLRREKGTAPGERLVERLAVACAPSATVWTALRARAAGRRGTGVVAVGDPAPGVGAAPETARLPGSAEEAREVAALYPEARRVLHVGADATVSGLSEGLAQPGGRWAAVHLACHALVDPERPRLSALVLANGERLDLDRVAAMTIDADVAVLSACETARGPFTHADGVVGFARSFFLAGTPRVVASCWRVPDAATRGLMRRFHQAMARDGLRPSQALRAAQLDAVRGGGASAHPSQWAAFVLWGLED